MNMTTIKDLLRDLAKTIRDKMVDDGDGWVTDEELEEVVNETTEEIKQKVVG